MATTQVLYSNPHRRAILLSPSTIVVTYYQFGSKSGANIGIELPTASTPVLLDYETFGDLVTWDVYVWNNNAAAITISILEAFES